MTWSRVKATGRGVLEFRVMVEGWPYQFVSHADMEQTLADGRIRIAGLQRDGLAIEEQAIPHEAKFEARGMVLSIVDRQYDDGVTAALTTRPTATTWLTADATKSATSFTVAAVTGFSSGDVVHIGTEAVYLGASPTGTTMGTLTRGYWDTIAQAHYTEDGDNLRLPAVTNKPLTLEGRRAYLYVYGDGDDPQGDGTLVWRGICSTDAKLDDTGVSWSVTIDHIAHLFAQDLGADLEEDVGPRGIYFPATAPLVLGYWDGGSSAYTGAIAPSADAFDVIYGHFEDNRALCDEINSRFASIISAVSGTAQSITAVPIGDFDYYLEVTVAASSPAWPSVVIDSPVDGLLVTEGSLIDADNALVATVSAGETYTKYFINGTRSVPRGYFGRCGYVYSLADAYGVDLAGDTVTYPPARVYLGGTVAVGDLSAVELELDTADSEQSDAFLSISSQNASDRHVTLASDSVVRGPYTPSAPLTLKFVRQYAFGGLDDFFSTITSDSPDFTNAGGGPFITDSDVSLSDFISVVARAARGRSTLLSRYYLSREAVSVSDYVAHECRLLSCYLGTASNGKMRPVQLRQVAPTEFITTTIGESETLVDDGWPSFERNAWGTINTVVVHSAYLPSRDEWLRRDTIRDVTAYSIRKQPKILEIKPRSATVLGWDLEASYRDHVETASVPLGVFGRDYALITVGVPMTMFDLLIGDVVGITAPNLPAMDGTRGIESARAIVVGRRWDLDQGRGQLTLLLTLEDLAGYTPSVTVTAQSNVSGNQWTLTVTSDAPSSGDDLFPSGANLSDFFAVGDEVRVNTWDNPAVASVTGAVDSVTDTGTGPATGTITVTFDATWTPSTHTWVLDFGSASAAVSRQQAFAYWSTTALRISFGTARAARVWGA